MKIEDSIKPSDTIEIIDGEHRGVIGIVSHVIDSLALVWPKDACVAIKISTDRIRKVPMGLKSVS